MKINKTLLIAFAVLLVAGIYAIAHLNQDSLTASNAEAENSRSRSIQTASGEDAKLSTRNKIRSQKISKDQELLNKYGEERTNLSRKLSDNLISMLDETVQMAEAGRNGHGSFGRGIGMRRGSIEMSVINSQIGLTEEQKVKFDNIYSDYQERQQEKTKDAVERLKKDPTPLMNLMLANDASARGEIKDKEYAQLKSKSEKDLEGVPSPVGLHNFFGMGSNGSPLKDDTFVAEYQSQLTPEQQSKFDESMASDNATNPSGLISKMNGDIADMPKMEMEELDTQIQHTKTMKEKTNDVMGKLSLKRNE